ncbi:amidase signature enzyme, partial [Viridothelium virens]
LDVGEDRFVAWPIAKTDLLPKRDQPFYITIIPVGSQDAVDEDNLQKCLRSDDVIKHEFLKFSLFVASSSSTKKPTLTLGCQALLRSWRCQWTCQNSSDGLAGPFVVYGKEVWQICRLYDDHRGAFLCSVRNNRVPGKFDLLNDGKHDWACCSVAVPSRLAHHFSRSCLSGVRVAIKDVFDINGLRTSNGSRAYLDLYPPAQSTAASIFKIIEGGAWILGKTRLSSFLSREEPSESVDFQTAWNPRADGYQGPGGSSSGSAVAVAAYDWVDIAIGTDTNGSIRRPSQCNGCLGLRLSRGIFSSEGMFTVFPLFDVPGLFSRDLDKLVSFAEGWYAHVQCDNRIDGLPLSIVAPEDFAPPGDSPQKRVVQQIVTDFEAYLGIDSRKLSISALWEQTPPVEAGKESLHSYLKDCAASTFLYANYHSTADFRNAYYRKFQKKPFVSPFVRWRWNIGASISKEEHEEGLHRLEVYKRWFLDRGMEVGKKNTLVIMQSEDVKPNYRDDQHPDYYIQPAWNPWWVSSILGAPEVVIPAGQIPYKSRITETIEQLPVVASIMGEPKSDLSFLKFVQDFLRGSGRPLMVETGRQMFRE